MTRFALRAVHGEEIAPYIKDLAKIRINVFREWPYIYDGSMSYEEEYLGRYAENDKSQAILIFADNDLVGMSTSMPLQDEYEDLRKPLEKEYDISRMFYYGETCLLSHLRGSGLYKEIFSMRENHARSFGDKFNKVCFCSVVRPNDHPLKPALVRPLDSIWERYGFKKLTDQKMSFVWKDLNEVHESRKLMDVWIKNL